MADNITVDTITGSPVVATDDISGEHWQYVKMSFGADGVATRVTADAPMPVTNYLAQVSMGQVTGASVVNKFGSNLDIDVGAGQHESLWHGGGDYTGFNAVVAETVQVFSSSADDTSAGTGARTIQIYGLNTSFVEQNETVTLNGTTVVTSVNSYIRLDRAIVRTAGSTGECQGDITIRQSTTTANVFATVPAGLNQTSVCCYTVPDGKTAHLVSWFTGLSGAGSANCEVRLAVRPTGEVFQVKERGYIRGAGQSSFVREFTLWPAFAERTDIKLEANTTSNNTAVLGAFSLLLTTD